MDKYNKNVQDFLDIIQKEFPKIDVEDGYFPFIGKIDKADTIDSILGKVFERGKEVGWREGAASKIKELREFLGIYTED